ncbi:MAG: ABC transporter substrate-binding protein [Nitrospirota bacterium]
MFKKSLIVFLLFILGCSTQRSHPGYLNLRLASDITTLDPAFIVDVAGGGVAAKLYDGLVGFDKGAKIVPDIASSYTVSPDGKTYTFRIRRGVRFQCADGSCLKDVTSRDFKYSFERVLSPETKSPRTWLFDRIAGAKEYMAGKTNGVSGLKTPDDSTLIIELAEPFGPFIELLAMPGAYVVPQEEVLRWGENFSDHPAGTGPYVLERWEHGISLSLRANKVYFGEKPKLAGIYYRVIPEDLTAVAEFERGNLDTLAIPAPELRRYITSPKWKDRIISQVGMDTYYLGMNCSRPPFDDPLVRKAVSMAIDRKRILDTVYEGRGVLADGPVPQSLLPGPERFPYEYNPALAQRLLARSGHGRGLNVKIFIGADQEVLDMAEVIQQYLKDVGIYASITQLEWSAYKQAIVNGDADAFWMSWEADYPDPENFLYPVFYSGNAGSAGNRSRLKDAVFDSLIRRAQTEPDPVSRRRLYALAQDRIVDLAPWVFFWHKKDFVAVSGLVKGYSLYPISSADKGLGVAKEGL